MPEHHRQGFIKLKGAEAGWAEKVHFCKKLKEGKGRYNGGGKEEKKMDETLKNIITNLGGRQIGMDEEFKFHCTECGKCCIHREDILLNPRDIYSMSKELGMSPGELFLKYCETYIGDGSRIPIVRIKPKGSVKRCPLLKDRKCSVHKSKPSVCALFPIGRVLQVGDTEGNIREVSVDDVQYIFSTPGCGDATERHTVRGWLGAFGIPLQDEFFIMWQKIIVETSMAYRRLEMKASPHVMQLAWQACFKGLYLHYDTGEDFLPQFEDNVKSFQGLLHKL